MPTTPIPLAPNPEPSGRAIRGDRFPLKSTWGIALFLLLELGIVPALSRVAAQDLSLYPSSPNWTWSVSDSSTCAAIGDLDGDGDLDLVVGNYGRNSVYHSDGLGFSDTPEWQALGYTRTRSVAVGDIDGDGNMDIVFGNMGRNRVYLYRNGNFVNWWQSPATRQTTAVALADMDGDGDLDLVCANGDTVGQANTIWKWSVDSFGIENYGQTEAWISQAKNPSRTLAVGDIDGDGDLDVAFGNYKDGSAPAFNTIYRNLGGVLQGTPSWTSFDARPTVASVLGDLDGNGYMDLLFGNEDGALGVHYNFGGSISTIPVFSVPLEPNLRGMALADADGDGLLDLFTCSYGGFSKLYLGDDVGFDSAAHWTSGNARNSEAIAVGSVRSGAGLEIVLANIGSNELYNARNTILSRRLTWESSLFSKTTSLAAGDVDGDGDVDLVCGNEDEPNRMYLNDGLRFEETPSWSSVPANATQSVDLGDIDGDGDLDLVCGNGNVLGGQSNTLYLNVGGTFSVSPDWESPKTAVTNRIRLIDFDRNGSLDLVTADGEVGNHGTVDVYLNPGSTFGSPPLSSPLRGIYRDIELTDFNLDGLMDFVYATQEIDMQGSLDTLTIAVITGTGGPFSFGSTWTFNRSPRSTSLAMLDIDNDGILDIAVGTSGDSSTVHKTAPFGQIGAWPNTWSAPAMATETMRFGDIGGFEGSYDLLMGNWGEPDVFFDTRDIRFGRTPRPFWESLERRQTKDAQIFDVDGDGRNDVIVGHYGQANGVYRGLQNLTYPWDPENPKHQLPDNDAFLSAYRAEKIGSNVLLLRFRAHDLESDPVTIEPRYFAPGQGVFPIDVPGFGTLMGPLPTSPAGRDYVIPLDLSTLLSTTAYVLVLLEVSSNPRGVPMNRQRPSYLLRLEDLDIRRSQMQLGTTDITFSTVTVGDTSGAILTMQNVGNEPLEVQKLRFPSSSMRSDPAAPFTVLPESLSTVNLFFEPVVGGAAGGNLVIESNDPAAASTTIPVQARARALNFSYRLLTFESPVPLGERLTFLITPDDSLNVEGGNLYFRPLGLLVLFESVPLLKTGSGDDDWFAVIPGDRVSERGLEYFVEIENSAVKARRPKTGLDVIEVSSPDKIVSAARPNFGDGFLENFSVEVDVFLPQGTKFKDGLLHFRTTGVDGYQSLALEKGDPSTVPAASDSFVFAEIPSTLAGPRGLQYWVELNTFSRRLTDPPFDPSIRPISIPVTVRDLVEPDLHPAQAYRMVSIPLLFPPSFTGTLEALLADQEEFGSYDPVKWRSFQYVPALKTYAELSDPVSARNFRPVPGLAYWLISREAHRISTSPISGFSTPSGEPWKIWLEPGFNQIGNPFVFPVAWDSLLVDSLAMSEAETLLVERARAWDPAASSYNDPLTDPVMELTPFEGYWVFNRTDSLVTLILPAVEFAPFSVETTTVSTNDDPGVPERARATTPFGGDETAWILRLGVRSGDFADPGNYAGVALDGRSRWDSRDHLDPPRAPGRGISLYFPHEDWARNSGSYCVDIRGSEDPSRSSAAPRNSNASVDWGHEWRFDVSKNFLEQRSGDRVVLTFDGVEEVPSELEVILVDREQARTVDLRGDPTFDFFMGKKERVESPSDARFALLIGSEGFVSGALPDPPDAFSLHPNVPNPFNPSTVIRYELARSGNVTLRVYDVRGALVRELWSGHRDTGRYETHWDGRNDSGRLVGSGVYFYRLEAEGYLATRKMLLLK